MRFLALTVENFGVFRGEHRFDLTAQRGKGIKSAGRNIVLVRGHNGAGKSTLFSAFALTLQGSLAVSDRLARADYNEFLLSRMHHKNSDGTLCDVMRLALSLEYVESGRRLKIDVERQWQRSGRVVTEVLQVRRDGAKPDEIAPEDYQTWINDLFPFGLSAVCFFDAERLDALSSATQHDAQLGEIMRRLLGLDLVERLGADLELYTLRQGGKQAEALRMEVFERQRELSVADAQIATLKTEIEALESRGAELSNAVSLQEQKLAAEGGTYAERRPQLQERRGGIGREIEALNHELRELCGELLPFALAPALCKRLSERLDHEAQIAQSALLGQRWQSRITELRERMSGADFWDGLDLERSKRQKISKRVTALLHELNAEAATKPLLHHLAEPERANLQEWIRKATQEVPHHVEELSLRLRALQTEARAVDAELGRAPDDAVLAPIHAEIERLNADLADVQRQQAGKSAQMASLQFAREEKQRLYHRAVEEFTSAQKTRQRLALAERSKVALRAYKDALTRRQLSNLERQIVLNFNRLCQKDQLLKAVAIDPETFAVTVQNVQGRALGLLDFSAGERQIYSLSLLWALRQTSDRVLPLLIDTPLGRLDETHRERMVSHFFPQVSRQVLLFTTDAELDEELLHLAQDHIARDYRLRFDALCEESIIERVLPTVVDIHLNGHRPTNVIPLQAVAQGGQR